MLGADTERWPDQSEASGNTINKENCNTFPAGYVITLIIFEQIAIKYN
jgi:hypothetical protein